jgi:hypothetical protein
MRDFIFDLLASFLRPALRRQPARPATLRFRPFCQELESRLVPAGTLGAASNFAVLGLVNTSIGNSGATINGNEGVSQGGSLNNLLLSTVNGTVYEHNSGQYLGLFLFPPSGGVVVNASLTAQADADALSLSSQAQALVPTQILGTVSVPTTVTGNGGLNVISVNGNITSSLTLSGGANDTFVVNVTGTASLPGGSSLALAGGVTADHVLYNFVGTGGTISSAGGTTINGTLLAPAYNFSLGGVVNGAVLGGGGSINFQLGARVNDVAFAGIPSVGPSSLSGLVTDTGKHAGMAGVTVTLTGSDYLGNTVSLTTTTAADGSYSFAGLAAGTYTLTVTVPNFYIDTGDKVGTVNGSADGTRSQPGVISGITLGGGQDGINYDFGMTFYQA